MRFRRRRCRARGISGTPKRSLLRIALVTGGSGGIGKACGRKLSELGYDVVLAARREGPLRAAAEEIGARHIVAETIRSGWFPGCAKHTRDDRPGRSCGRHAGRNLRAQADIRAVAGNHVGQPGFVLRGDLRGAAADARGLAAGVHLIVGGTRADDGPHPPTPHRKPA